MRIISGTKRGLKLTPIRRCSIRPTADSTKEIIFNVIREYINNSDILDIFAGSGSLGIEALSRGAVRAIFIENNQFAQRILVNNLKLTGFLNKSEIIRSSAKIALKRLSDSRRKFDLIFADPPYENYSLAQETVITVDRLNLLTQNSWLIIEHSDKNELLNLTEHLNLKIRKRQGNTTISFYQND